MILKNRVDINCSSKLLQKISKCPRDFLYNEQKTRTLIGWTLIKGRTLFSTPKMSRCGRRGQIFFEKSKCPPHIFLEVVGGVSAILKVWAFFLQSLSLV